MAKARQALVQAAAVILASIYPVMFLFFQNAGEVGVGEVWQPLLLFCAAGFAVFSVLLIAMRSFPRAAVGAIVCLLMLANGALIERGFTKLFPQLTYWHFLPIAAFLLFEAVYLVSKIPEEAAKKAGIVLLVVFAGLTVFNLVTAIPALKERAQQSVRTDTIPTATVGTEEDDANIYYFIFDEFSSFETLKKYYGDDNKELETFLIDTGFTISYDSFNDSESTLTVTANLMHLDYVAFDTDPEALLVSLRQNNQPLFQLLDSHGYRVTGAARSDDFFLLSEEGESESDQSARTIEGYDFLRVLLNNTVLYPVFERNTAATPETEKLVNMRQYFLYNAVFHPGSKTFTIAYIDAPHMPFLYARDGTINDVLDWNNIADPDIYLGYQLYISGLIKEIMARIVSEDPGCIIIVQSDHSSRFLEQEGVNVIEHRDKVRFFNAVYFKGQPIPEIQGQSGVNTLRIILSRQLGVNLPPVEVPQ